MKHIFSPTTCAASFPAGITSILTEFTRPLCHEISSEAPVGIKPNYIEWKLISSLIDSFPGSFNHITWPSLANEGWLVDVDVKSFRFTCGLFCANVKVLHPVSVDRPAVVVRGCYRSVQGVLSVSSQDHCTWSKETRDTRWREVGPRSVSIPGDIPAECRFTPGKHAVGKAVTHLLSLWFLYKQWRTSRAEPMQITDDSWAEMESSAASKCRLDIRFGKFELTEGKTLQAAITEFW